MINDQPTVFNFHTFMFLSKCKYRRDARKVHKPDKMCIVTEDLHKIVDLKSVNDWRSLKAKFPGEKSMQCWKDLNLVCLFHILYDSKWRLYNGCLYRKLSEKLDRNKIILLCYSVNCRTFTIFIKHQ